MDIVLRLLRRRRKILSFTAHHGAFQKCRVDASRKMLRVNLNRNMACIPKSAPTNSDQHPLHQCRLCRKIPASTEQDVPFRLTFCQPLLIMQSKNTARRRLPALAAKNINGISTIGFRPFCQRTLQDDRLGKWASRRLPRCTTRGRAGIYRPASPGLTQQ